MATPCWRIRNCEQDMQSGCPHAVTDFDMCPARCSFATCDRPTYELTSDPDLVFAGDVDRNQALKQGCIWCKFFLTNAPRLDGQTQCDDTDDEADA